MPKSSSTKAVELKKFPLPTSVAEALFPQHGVAKAIN